MDGSAQSQESWKADGVGLDGDETGGWESWPHAGRGGHEVRGVRVGWLPVRLVCPANSREGWAAASWKAKKAQRFWNDGLQRRDQR